MADGQVPHLDRSGRHLADPRVVVEFKGRRFGAEFVTAEKIRDALVWHFRPATETLFYGTEAPLEKRVTLRYREGGVTSFPYGRLWRRRRGRRPDGLVKRRRLSVPVLLPQRPRVRRAVTVPSRGSSPASPLWLRSRSARPGHALAGARSPGGRHWNQASATAAAIARTTSTVTHGDQPPHVPPNGRPSRSSPHRGQRHRRPLTCSSQTGHRRLGIPGMITTTSCLPRSPVMEPPARTGGRRRRPGRGTRPPPARGLSVASSLTEGSYTYSKNLVP